MVKQSLLRIATLPTPRNDPDLLVTILSLPALVQFWHITKCLFSYFPNAKTQLYFYIKDPSPTIIVSSLFQLSWYTLHHLPDTPTRNKDLPTNIAPATLQWASRGQPPHGGQPPLIHWVARKCAARWASGGWPPLSLLFYHLTLLYVSWTSSLLVLASNSQANASSVPPPEQARGTELASSL